MTTLAQLKDEVERLKTIAEMNGFAMQKWCSIRDAAKLLPWGESKLRNEVRKAEDNRNSLNPEPHYFRYGVHYRDASSPDDAQSLMQICVPEVQELINTPHSEWVYD